jgi:hypothetical protein
MARTGFWFMRKRCNDGAQKKNGKKFHVQHYLDSLVDYRLSCLTGGKEALALTGFHRDKANYWWKMLINKSREA